MPLPFQYQRIQRQPLDERLPDGRPAVLPQIQPYNSSDPSTGVDSNTGQGEPLNDQSPQKPQIPWRGISPQQPTPQPSQPSAPAIDPRTVQGAFPPPPAQPAVSTTPESVKMDEPAPTMLVRNADGDVTGGIGPTAVVKDKYGRPDQAVGSDDELTRNQELLKAVRAYQPQPATGWRRYLGPILAGANIGAKAGGGNPWAMLGGTIAGAITGKIKPKWDDERWQAAKEQDVQGDIEDQYKQAKTQAELDNYKSLAAQRTANQKFREQTQARLDQHQKDVQGNTAITNLIHQYDRLESYDPNGSDAQSQTMSAQAAKLGVVLGPKNPAMKGGFTFDGYRWVRDPKSPTGYSPLKDASGDPERDDQYEWKLKDIKDQIRHRGVQEQQGQQRLNQTQQRIDISKMNSGAQGQFKTRFNQAREAVNRFNDLTRRATEAGAWGDAQAQVNQSALIGERDKLEQQIRDQYGDLVSDDDKSKPTRLRRMWSASQFKKSNPGADVKAAQESAQSDGAIIIP